MSPSVKNRLFGAIAIGAGFAAAVGFSVFAPLCFPVLAHNSSLLHAWRYIVAFFAIILMRMLLEGSMPRIRIMS
jgi:hypothetical protein